MKNGSAKAKCLFLLGGLCIVALFVFLALSAKPVAAVANNQTINFQGRLLNSQGATVPDGFYNIEFKIYQDGDGQSAGDSTGSPSGSLKWTEDYLNQASHGVKVVNGFMSVQLGSLTAFGSNIDWNQGTLWLSMNVAGTGASCTPFSSCSPDGEMLPMQPLTASPYSLNTGELNGLTSNNFVQLAQGVQTDASTSSSIYINKTGASGSILELQKGGVDVMNVSNAGTLLLKPSTDSATALQIQNHANGYSVFAVDTSGNAVVLGQASNLTGKLQFATAGGGTLTISPTSSASSFTVTFPGETGTVCTTAAAGVCNTAGGLSNVAYLNQTQSFTGQNTLSRNGSGSGDYTLGITGTPAASSTSSLVRIGNALASGGNGALNGGTYLSIVEPSSGAGSAADFFNLQNGSTVELQLTSGGNLTVNGTYNGNTFDNAGHLTFGNAGAATISSNASGANNLTVDTGNSGAILALGNTAGTTNLGTTNAAHTIGIGTGGGGTNTEAVTIGAATNSSSTLTLQGGSSGSSIVLQTGNNGSTAGAIQIGNTSGAFSQTISIGNNNNAANVVSLGTGTSQDNVTIGDNTNASSSVSLKAGSTGGISLGANTTLSANSNFTYATGTGGFDAHNGSGTFQTSTGNNSLNGATTVTGTNTFTVNGGATTLNGAAAGSGTAAKINTNAASNLGLVIQGASSQAAFLLQLQDSSGANVLSSDAGGDQEQVGYLDTPYGGIGSYSNLIVRSEQLGTTWSATNITVTQNDAGSNPAPDGNTTADKLVAAASGTATLTQTYASAGNNTYTFSIWLKTNTGGDTAQLRIDSNGTPATGTAKSFNLTTTWQRVSVTQSFTSGVTSVTPTLIMNNNSVLSGWGGQLVLGLTPQVYVRTTSSVVAASDGVVGNGSAIFKAAVDSTTAFQIQDAGGGRVFAADTQSDLISLGTANALNGKIKFFNASGSGSITLDNANPSSTNYTVTLPAENGTICTTAASAACTAVYAPAGGGYVNFAPSSAQADASNNSSIFINKTSGTGNILQLQKSASDVFKVDNSGNVSSTGQNTLSRNSSGASDYTFGVTGTTSATGSSSLVRIGSALSGGNGAANGGTYLSIVEPSSGAGSAADFLNLQNGSTVELQLTSAGNLIVGGTYNGNTFDNTGHLTFGNAGAATISSNGSNNLTIDTGSSGGTETLGNNAATTNVATSNATHAVHIGDGGSSTAQTITIGSNTNTTSTLTLQGGNGAGAITLQTGNNGATAGSIVIGNSSSATSQTTSIGSSNTNASATNIVNIGTAASATDSVTIGSTSNANSSVVINGGSTGGITLAASTTNINSGTISTNQSTIGLFNATATNVTAFGAGTSIGLGATTGTLTINNANTTIGSAAGSGVFTNNGASVNATLSLGDFATGGSIGTAANTVDKYTSISVGQTTSGQTLTIPSPTASTTYGRVVYISNIGTQSFILAGVRVPTGDTATLMWSNTNGGASWQFAGAGASSIENQNTNDQSADFRINGTGRANTSFVSPLFDSITGGLSLGTSTATSVTVGGTTNTTTITLQGAAGTNILLGNSAGFGVVTNNGATVNTTLALSDFPSGGAIGTAANTVDKYTSFSVNQTTAGQTLTIPSPTASTAYGRTIYLSNVGSQSFILSGVRVPTGDTATMMWANTTGGASWQFAGAGASSIENQNTSDQSADFRISGTGRASTSFTSPLFDSITGALGIGTSTATGVNIGGTTNTTSIVLQGAAGATYTIGTSNNTGGITLGNSTGTNTISIGSAAGNGATQTINIGTSATTGSTTRVNIGSSIAGYTQVNGKLGVGTSSTPNEALQVNGAINLGNTTNANAGTIRWNSTTSDFEGYNGTAWKSMTTQYLSVNPVVNAIKTSNTTITNNSTLQSDSELKFTIGANENWNFRFVVSLQTSANNNGFPTWKFHFDVPQSTTLCTWGYGDFENAVTVSNNLCSATVTFAKQQTSAQSDEYELMGIIENGSTAQTVTLQYAQSAASSNNTLTLQSGSFMQANRVLSAGDATLQAFVLNGNAFGASAYLGTNDAYDLFLQTNGQSLADFSSSNGSATFKNYANSTQGFQVQDLGGNSLFNVDTSNDRVVIGKPSSFTGNLSLANSGTANTVTLSSGSTSANYTILLPTNAGSANQCLQYGGSGNQLQWAACGTNSTGLAKNATDSSSASVGSGSYLYSLANSNTATTSSVLKLDNGSNTNSTLFATASGNPQSGQAIIYAQDTNASPSGNLLDLRAGSSPASVFNVGADGSVNVVGGASSTFNAKVANSSATAFQVQTAGGTSYLTIDSTNGKVSIGAGSSGETSGIVLALDTDTNATFNAGTATSAPNEVDGAMFYSSTSNSFLCGVAGSWETCNGLLYSNTAASSAVNACTTACAAFSKSAPIPANYCQAGRVIHIIARGIYGLQNVASQTYALGVYYGTDGTTKTNDTLLGTSTSTTNQTNLTNNGWKLDTTIVCYDTTHMQTEGDFTYSISNTAATAGQTVLQNDTATTGTTVTSTSAKNIYLFPAFGANNANNTATLQQLIVTGN